MNLTTFNIAPMRVSEGENIINKDLVLRFKQLFGKHPCIIIKKDVLDKFGGMFKKIFDDAFFVEFMGECSYEQGYQILDLLRDKNISSVIGIGGGKAIDQAKFVASKMAKPMIMIPTSAATGAAASALSAMYTVEGASICYEVYDKAADLVILDYTLIMDAPVEFMAFGMADSLAKYYEALAFTNGDSDNIFIQTAIKLSCFIKDVIFEIGEQVLSDCKLGNITQNFKNMAKINIILAMFNPP